MRTLKFIRDTTIKEVNTKFDGNPVISILGKGNIFNIRVPPGLPNTTRPSVSYYQNYDFEKEKWWPKFQKCGITVIKGDRKNKLNGGALINKKINNNTSNNNNQPISKSTENLNVFK